MTKALQMRRSQTLDVTHCSEYDHLKRIRTALTVEFHFQKSPL